MKKSEWSLVYFLLIAVWLIDRVTKLWALDLQGIQSFGPLHFALHYNPGAMLGLFSDLPPVLRTVSLSTGGAFLVCIYALLQYLIPIKSMILRCGLSIVLGGILGNVADRIAWGHIVDFIIVGTPDFSSPAFNLADFVQWFGYAMIIYSVIKEGDLIWPENSLRKSNWVNRKFQLKYCFFLFAVGFGISLISIVFAYTYMRVTIIELIGPNQMVLDKFMIPFVLTFSIVCLASSISLFAIGKILSHQIAGPIFAFEKYLKEALDDKKNNKPIRDFQLRNKDEFKHLEDLAKTIKDDVLTKFPK